MLKDSHFYNEKRSQWLITGDAEIPVETVQTSLKDYGLCVLRGLNFSRNEFLEFASRFGTALNQSPEGCMLFEVKNEGYDPAHPKFRGPSSNRELTFHTDRCDVIVFYCVNQAVKGGVNLFVHAEALYETLKNEEPELLRVLENNFPYKRHNADPAHPLPYYELPVFGKEEELSLTLMTYLINRADIDPELPNLTAMQRQALNKVQEICKRPDVHLQIKLQPGDVLFLNNLQMLHSRTAFKDAGERLFYRIWLSVPWSIRLPKSFETLFGAVEAGAVRGGFRKF